MVLDPEIWGPKYWFVLMTISLNYPLYPNEISKKKYYDLIQNIPLLIPVKDISNSFSKLLDDFPVTPYLDSRESFIKWVHFIHNKMNILSDKPEVTLEEALEEYYENYKSLEVKESKMRLSREKIAYILILILLVVLTAIVYKK
tara:strand:+ start:3096 stop:3527 length:432 start_codon:yes stop_codon:yes gene_type:complete